MVEQRQEPPVGFSVGYWDGEALHAVGVALDRRRCGPHDAGHVKKVLWNAFLSLCRQMPKPPTKAEIGKAVHEAIDDPPEAA
jgi:hypothetical protein